MSNPGEEDKSDMPFEGNGDDALQELDQLVYEENAQEEMIVKKMSNVKDASNGLSYSRMKQRIDRTHPRLYIEGEFIQYPICKTSTGWNFPISKLRQTDMKDFGVGICIYFKWLKYLICIFLIATIISVPLFVFFIGASTTTYTSNKSLDTLLELTTLGNMGSPSTSCSKATNLSSKVQVRCSYGKIDSIAKFGGKDSKNSKSSCINNGANLEVISTCDYDSFGTSFKTAFDSQFNTKCYGKKNCQIDLSKLSFPTTCNSTNNAYLKIYCNSDSIVETTRSKAAYIIICFDFACILFIWIAFEVHDTYERLENIEINDKILDGSDFTVEISNIPYHDDVRILKAQTWKYIEQILQKSIQEDPKIQDPNCYKIAQCNLALTKYSIMSNYKARLRFEKEFKILNIKENILKNSIANQNKIDKEKMNIEKKRIKLKAKSDENEKAILELKRTLDVKAVRIYITMQSMEGKDKLIEMFYSNKHRRCCGLIKSKSHQLQNNKIVIKEAPKASTINWENLAISKSKRCIRISIVYLFSLLLIIISFAVMIITKNYQRELNDEYNTSSCSSTVTMDQALQDYLNTKGERAGFMFCYCQQQYNDMGYSVKDIVFTNGETYCSTWYTDYVSAILLVYVLAFTMQIINVVVKTILRLASKLEKRENKHEEVISNIFKMSLTQLINSAILLLIVNMKLEFMPTWFPVFAGDYNDFSASWYTYVGSTIMIMMLFSIITPHIANFFLHFVRFTIRCFDRGCTRDVKRTKKIFQIDYETLYLGPEYLIEFRYSNMIVMVYLALLFGGGMPILYFFAACIFCVTYWIDKITLLRIYRKPPRFGIEVIRFARNMLIVGVILHFGFNFWMYSNSLVFNSYSDNLFKFGTQTIDSISNVTYSWLRLDIKINQIHTFIYALFFCGFIILFSSRNLIRKCLTYLLCRRLLKSKVGNDENSNDNYFANLEKSHLEVIINKSKNELQDFIEFTNNLRNNVTQEISNEDILWYIENLKSIISKCEEALKTINLNTSSSLESSRQIIADHTYDISEIFPYNVFFASENSTKDSSKYKAKLIYIICSIQSCISISFPNFQSFKLENRSFFLNLCASILN